MIRQEIIQESISLLGRFSHEVKISNAMGLFDINKVAEDFLIPILSIALKCPDLCNQNKISLNFPAVDLGCRTSRISIQITSDATSDKVCETLNKFISHNLGVDFDTIYIYVITERQSVYTSKKVSDLAKKMNGSFMLKNIIDFKDLAGVIKELSNPELECINTVLKEGFRQKDRHLKFKGDLESFIKSSQNKINDEKRTKKYIPSVFVEATNAKEDMRYFSNPLFFSRGIDNEINKINMVEFNKLLAMSKIDPVEDKSVKIANLSPAINLPSLLDRLDKQLEIVDEIKKDISPFSWRSNQSERYIVSSETENFWEVFQMGIQSSGSGILNRLEVISKKIEITGAKIFLVTGMAGQGKTNFICDIIENQFSAFEIPSIFIPARVLNDYTGPNRILSHIRNNRFSPECSNLHDLLNLLNSVAEECDKPFIIALDGINEVSDLDGFSSELKIFLEALCQYEYVKAIISCRNEFFEYKFSSVFDTDLSNSTYRINNLHATMSETNKERLLDSYHEYFKIKGGFSQSASEFLANDLIMLRIFCEINEGQEIGFVTEIYKGDVFEKYLIMKINEFPIALRQLAIRTLYKICENMLSDANFSQVPIEGFDNNEIVVIDKLISEDIILRREMPSISLANVGIENASFTYDEMRDFLLAYYVVIELESSDISKTDEIIANVKNWQIYEGFFRYLYILSRKHKSERLITLCESFSDFNDHYLNNLRLLPHDIQTSDDVARIKAVLASSSDGGKVRIASIFLFRRRNPSHHLNIKILIEHIELLNNESLEVFFKTMFTSAETWRNDWEKNLNYLLKNFMERDVDEIQTHGVSLIAFVFSLVSFSQWDVKEELLNFITRHKKKEAFSYALEICSNFQSDKVRSIINEILMTED